MAAATRPDIVNIICRLVTSSLLSFGEASSAETGAFCAGKRAKALVEGNEVAKATVDKMEIFIVE